jgi:hypothetical protein
MKNSILLAILLIFPAVSYAQPSITFEAVQHDFGTIEKGDILEYTFEFSNSGDQDLIIQKLVAS